MKKMDFCRPSTMLVYLTQVLTPSVRALEAHCLQIWENIRGSELCNNLINSMRSRMQAVIDQNGGYTSY